ncbi:MAG: aspartate dehydrogenase domain-containing protein [Pseudomonadota bacterium]
MKQKIGVVGVGALGSIVVKALIDGIDGYDLIGVSDITPPAFDVPHMSTEDLVEQCDIIVECLPPAEAPALAKLVLERNKTLILISSSALLLYPEIEEYIKTSESGRVIVPSGAISGLDAVTALKEGGMDSAKIMTTKPPKGLMGAPYVVENGIDLNGLSEKKCIFSGNAYEAAKAFPANVNVAATLSYASLGPKKTQVEVWADPNAQGNAHEIVVSGGSSTITSRVENLPDPSNPKSSMLAGYSIVATLRKLSNDLSVI